MLYSLSRHVVKMGAHPGYLILHRNGFQDIIKDDILEERGLLRLITTILCIAYKFISNLLQLRHWLSM